MFMEFNQEKSHIIIYNNEELRIININPFKLVCLINDLPKIKIARMLYRSNLIFYVGDDIQNEDSQSNFTPNILNIYDDAKKEIIDNVKLNSQILDVQIIKNYISLLSDKFVHIYKLDNLKNYIYKFEVCNNNFLLSEEIFVYMEHNKKSKSSEVIKIFNLDNAKSIKIKAHENKIKYLALNNKSTQLATSSEKGTIIRIFDVHTL